MRRELRRLRGNQPTCSLSSCLVSCRQFRGTQCQFHVFSVTSLLFASGTSCKLNAQQQQQRVQPPTEEKSILRPLNTTLLQFKQSKYFRVVTIAGAAAAAKRSVTNRKKKREQAVQLSTTVHTPEMGGLSLDNSSSSSENHNHQHEKTSSLVCLTPEAETTARPLARGSHSAEPGSETEPAPVRRGRACAA